MITRNLLETVLRISNSASKDETRMHLCGVHVYKKDDLTIIEAIDGHKLVRETLLNDESSIDRDVILEGKDIKKLKKFLKDYKRTEFEASFNDHSLVLNVGQDLVSIMIINREFPRVDSVIPSEKKFKVPVSITLNPDLLVSVLESLKLSKHDNFVTLTFDATNSLGAMLVNVGENKDQVAVVMPAKSLKSEVSAERVADMVTKKKTKATA